jgi:hypothetical protein
MVAHTQSGYTLTVAFYRNDDWVESVPCRDSQTAYEQALHLLSKHQPLQAGDTLVVHDESVRPPSAADAFSSSSHSG